MRCSEWADEYFYLSPESSAIQGRFDPWPYQTAVLDCMGNDEIRRVNVIKCARVGYTKCLAAATGYFHHHKKRNVVIYLPTDDEAAEFSKDTIDPMLRDVPELAAILTTTAGTAKENTLGTKNFLGSMLHVKGGKTPRAYRRLTKDVVIYDELDGFDQEIGKEGDPVSLGDKRCSDAVFPKSIRGSTPTVLGVSLIDRSASEADVMFKFRVLCPECGVRDSIEWGGIKYDDQDHETARYVCPHCQGEWYYSQMPEILPTGRYENIELNSDGVQLPPTVYIDPESNLRQIETDEEIKFPAAVAFQWWSGMSLNFQWSELVREWIEANESADKAKLRTFINTRLGECWAEEIHRVEGTPLFERREEYKAVVPDEVSVLTCGIDVQADRIEYEVVGWGAAFESWSIEYERLYGDTQKPEVWDQLATNLRCSFLNAAGTAFKIKRVCMDSGYLADDVYRFSKRMGVQWLVPVKGLNVYGRPVAEWPIRPSKKKGVYLTMVGTDTAKESIYQRLKLTAPGPGYCHWPIEEIYDEEYFAQLTGEVKKPTISRGRKVMAWEQEHGAVEALDCRVYAMAALQISMDHFGVKLPKLESTAEAPAAKKKAPRKPKSRRRESWFNR